MDNVKYDRCPFCLSKKVYEERVNIGRKVHVITKCGNKPDCGCQIDTRVEEEPNG